MSNGKTSKQLPRRENDLVLVSTYTFQQQYHSLMILKERELLGQWFPLGGGHHAHILHPTQKEKIQISRKTKRNYNNNNFCFLELTHSDSKDSINENLTTLTHPATPSLPNPCGGYTPPPHEQPLPLLSPLPPLPLTLHHKA